MAAALAGGETQGVTVSVRLAARLPACVAALVCAYEVAAITTRRVPTVTALCGRHRLLGPLVIAALAVHLYPRLIDGGARCAGLSQSCPCHAAVKPDCVSGRARPSPGPGSTPGGTLPDYGVRA